MGGGDIVGHQAVARAAHDGSGVAALAEGCVEAGVDDALGLCGGIDHGHQHGLGAGIDDALQIGGIGGRHADDGGGRRAG